MPKEEPPPVSASAAWLEPKEEPEAEVEISDMPVSASAAWLEQWEELRLAGRGA